MELYAGSFSAAVGLYGAIAWLGPFPWLIDTVPGAPLVFGSALGLLLSGLALVWHRCDWPAARIARQGIAALLIAGGFCIQLDYALDLNLGFDFRALHLRADSAKLADTLQPGRMPWAVALAFFCIGVTLLLTERPAHRRSLSIAETVAVAPGLIGALALIDYLLMYDDAYVNVYSVHPPMSVLMAVSLFMLSAGLWAGAAGKRAAVLANREPEDERIVRAAAFVMIPVVVLAGFGGFDASRNLVERAMRDSLIQTLNDDTQHIQALFNEHIARASLVTVRPAIVDAVRNAGERQAAQTVLTREVDALLNTNFAAARFESADGTVLAQAGAYAPTIGYAAEISQSPEAKLYWADGFRVRTRMPIMAGNEIVGYALMEQRLPTLTAIALSLNATNDTGEILIAFREGDAIYNFPSRFSHEPRVVPASAYLSVTHAISGRIGMLKTRDYRDEEVLSAFSSVGDTGLGVVVKVNVDEFYGPIAQQFRLWVVLMTLGVMVALLTLRALVRPLAVKLMRSEEEARQASDVLRETHARLERGLASLSERNEEMATLIRMSRALQACNAAPQVYDVVAQFGPQLFPREAGSLYLLEAGGLRPFTSWHGGVALGDRSDACSVHGLCRESAGCNVRENLACKRLTHPAAQAEVTLCIPVTAHERVLGILLVRLEASPDREVVDARRHLAVIIAEHIGLALDSLQLRDKLRNDSLRDPLTGLYNRRYLDEAYQQAEANAVRHQQPLAMMLIDMDYFKRLNDTFGHEAGDTVLRAVGALLSESVREGDTPCRLGGEEFAVLLPNATMEQAHARAEELRQAISGLRLEHQGQPLGTLTVSIGLAGYPACGDSLRELVMAADEALYMAKADGRNCVRIAPCSVRSRLGRGGGAAA